MLDWLKDKNAVQIRKDYQVGHISKKEATEKLVSIIANKMPTLIKIEKHNLKSSRSLFPSSFPSSSSDRSIRRHQISGQGRL